MRLWLARLAIFAVSSTIVGCNRHETQTWGLPQHTKEVEPRQQEVITGSCTPQTAYVEYATCIPYAAESSFCMYASGTVSPTVGCDVKNSTQTSTLASLTLTASCMQAGCPGCVSDDNSAPTTSGTDCTECTTVNGSVYLPPLTLSADETPTPGVGAPPFRITGRNAEQTMSDQPSSIVRSILKLVTRTFKLFKRRMTTEADFDGSHDHFMLTQIARAKSFDTLVEHRQAGTGGWTSAKVRNFGQEAFVMAVQGLIGCTSVVVISRQGAWISHIWEDSMMGSLSAYAGYTSFDDDVYTGIFMGDNSGYLPGLNDFSDGRSFFNDHTYGDAQNFVQVIIVTPHWDWPWDPEEPWKYVVNVNRIKGLLQNTYGIVPMVVPYRVTGEGDRTMSQATKEQRLATTAAGKVVIQYDPQEYEQVPDTIEVDGQQHGPCLRQVAAFRVYADVQETWVASDTWVAMPHQQVLPPNTQQVLVRDESSGNVTGYACTKQPATNGTCPMCSSPGACDIGPDDDQGEDGTPPTTFGSSTRMPTASNTNASSSANATSFANVTATISTSSSVDLTSSFSSATPSANVTTTINATTTNVTAAISTSSPVDLTSLFSSAIPSANATTSINATTTAVSGISGCSILTSSSCTLTTLPAETAPNGQPYAFAPTSCACGGSLDPTGSTKGNDGVVTATCAANQVCACPSGVTASMATLTGSDAKETYNCVDSSGSGQAVGTASTTIPLALTDCSLTSSSTGTKPGFTPAITQYATVCNCNEGQTMAASSSTADAGGIGVYCGTGTAAILVTTIAAPMTSTQITTSKASTSDAPPPPTSCQPFLATNPPGVSTSRSGWKPQTFCSCDHDRTMAYNSATTTNGNIILGCGWGATDIIVPLATETPTPSTIPFTNYISIWSETHTLTYAGKKLVTQYSWNIWSESYPFSNQTPHHPWPCTEDSLTSQLYNDPGLTYPKLIQDIILAGHANCAYRGVDGKTVGHIECDDSYTTACVAVENPGKTKLDCGNEMLFVPKARVYEERLRCDYHDSMVVENVSW